MLREIVELYFSARVSRSAAELAYFMVLTFFPLLICVNALAGVVDPNLFPPTETLQRFLPEGVAAILADYMTYITENHTPSMFPAGLVMTLISASAAVRALMKIMEEIDGGARYEGLGRLIASLIFAVLLLITIYLSIGVLLTGDWFFHLLARYVTLPSGIGDWKWLRFLLLFAMVLFFILLLYRFTGGKAGFPVLPGAILGSISLALASMLFSWLMSMSTRYSLVYGSLASVIIMLLWLYLCGNVLILGNVFNRVWYRRK